MRRSLVIAALLASTTAASGDVDARGDGWVQRRDVDTGVVAELWGGRSPAPGAVADAAVAERAARDFIAANLALLAPGSSIEDFVVVGNVAQDGTRTVGFQQTWRGLRVVGAQVAVVIARDAVFAAQSQAVPYVALALGPQIVDAVAPRVLLPITRDERRELHVVDERRERSGHDDWTVYTRGGREVARTNRTRSASSTLLIDVPAQRPTSTRVALPARELGILVDGTPTTTAPDGSFAWTGPTASVVTSVIGTRVRVTNRAGTNATATLTATDGQPTTWSMTDEASDAQLSAFVHTSIGKAKARQIAPALSAWLDQPLDVSVNESGGACNASAAGDGLHFFAGNAVCENTARLADVVYHELGHLVHAQSVIAGAGAFDPALSEGLADFFAASITGDSGIGRGFQFDATAVREIDPVGFERVAPDDLQPSQHQSGLVIGGTLWDLRRVAGAAVAERVLVGLMQRAPNISGSYMAALIADDDDGDLGNGTPNQCDIDYAFARHGLAPASVQITKLGAMRVEDGEVIVPVIEPPVAACGDHAITSATLRVRETAIAMTFRDGAWRASLPALRGVVRFEIEVVLDDASTLHLPNNPADPQYTAFLGDTDEIWCERFDADPQWMQTAMGTPSPWEWGAPRGLAGDPMSGFTGANAFGTDLTEDGRYGSVTQTQVHAPAVIAPAYAEVHLQFRRWLTVEDALYDRASVQVNGTTLWSNVATPEGFVTHADREWRFVDLDVTAFAGDPIEVTWEIASDASRALGGWTLDDVCLVGVRGPAVCGNAIVDDTEECDGDPACSSECTLPDDDNCCSVGANPRGTLLLVLGVLVLLRRRRRP